MKTWETLKHHDENIVKLIEYKVWSKINPENYKNIGHISGIVC